MIDHGRGGDYLPYGCYVNLGESESKFILALVDRETGVSKKGVITIDVSDWDRGQILGLVAMSRYFISQGFNVNRVKSGVELTSRYISEYRYRLYELTAAYLLSSSNLKQVIHFRRYLERTYHVEPDLLVDYDPFKPEYVASAGLSLSDISRALNGDDGIYEIFTDIEGRRVVSVTSRTQSDYHAFGVRFTHSKAKVYLGVHRAHKTQEDFGRRFRQIDITDLSVTHVKGIVDSLRSAVRLGHGQSKIVNFIPHILKAVVEWGFNYDMLVLTQRLPLDYLERAKAFRVKLEERCLVGQGVLSEP